MEIMDDFPWMKSVYQAFSRTFPAEYNSEALKLLNKHLEEEYKQALNADVDNLKKLYSCLRTLYNHFCWKINWHKESHGMKICCIKILSYLIKIGILLSKGKTSSKWINRVLAAMRLFPGEFDLLCNALLLLQKLKTSCHRAFAIILKHFLYTNQIKTEEPAAYFKILLLIRRLKFLTSDKYEKSKLSSFATRTHCPRNALPWLTAQGIHQLPKMENITLAKKLLSKNLSSKFIKHLRKVLLSGVENNMENVVIHNESFTIDSRMVIEKESVSNAVKKTATKQMTKKRSSKNISHSLTDELCVNDIECNNFLPKKKTKKATESLSQELPNEFENSVLTDITQSKESSYETNDSFTDWGFSSHSRKKERRKRKNQNKFTRNVKDNNFSEVDLITMDDNAEAVHESVELSAKKLTNRKSESIEITSEKNDKLSNYNIICPEQLFIIDNVPVSDYEETIKIISDGTLHNEDNLKKYSCRMKNESKPLCVPMSSDLTPVKGNQLLNENDSSDEDSYGIFKSSNNLKDDCFIDKTEQKKNNISKTINFNDKNSEREFSLRTNASISEEEIIGNHTGCDNEISEDSSFEKIREEKQPLKSTILDDENHLNDNFSSSSRICQTELQSANKTVFLSSDYLDSPQKCVGKVISDFDSLERSFESEVNEVVKSDEVLSTNVSVPQSAILNSYIRHDTKITEDSILERIKEEKHRPSILIDESQLNSSCSYSICTASENKLQSTTETITSNSESLNLPEKCEGKFTSGTDKSGTVLKENFETGGKEVLKSDEECSPERISEDQFKMVPNNMCKAVRTVHERFEQALNSDVKVVDMNDFNMNSRFSNKIDSSEVGTDDMENWVMPSNCSLSNEKPTNNTSNEIQNSILMDAHANENVDTTCQENNEQSCMEYYLKKNLNNCGMEREDNIFNEEQLIHSETETSVVGNVQESQSIHQLLVDNFEKTKNEENVNHDVLDCYIKKVLNKMVDKVANKMDDAVEASSFEVLKEKMLKEGLTPLKFSPVCKITNTLTNFEADSLKAEGISPEKIKTCLTFSDISSECSGKLESDNSHMLNELSNKDFCTYREKLFELKDDMSDSGLSIEQESERNLQGNHSCSNSETESDDDIDHSKQNADIQDRENDVSSPLQISDNDSVMGENSYQCTNEIVTVPENTLVDHDKNNKIVKQPCMFNQTSPQGVITIKTFPPEQIHQFTSSQPAVIVNLGKRCDNMDVVINKMKTEDKNSSDIEAMKDASNVFEGTDSMSPKIIHSQVINNGVEKTQIHKEEIIDATTLKGLFVYENWDEDCYSQNNELDKGSKNQSQNASHSSQSDISETDLSQSEITITLPNIKTIEKVSDVKSPIYLKKMSEPLDSGDTTEIGLSVNKTTASLTASELLEKESNIKTPIKLKEVSMQLDYREVTENIVGTQISKHSSVPSRMNLRKRLTDLPIDKAAVIIPSVSEVPENDPSVKSPIKLNKVSVQLNPIEVSNKSLSINNSNLINSSTKILEKEVDFKVPSDSKVVFVHLDPMEVTKSVSAPKINEESAGSFRMNLRRRQTSTNQTDLSVNTSNLPVSITHTLEKENNVTSNIQMKDLCVHLDSSEANKNVLVHSVSEKSDKTTDKNQRKHHSIQADERETLSRTPKSKKSMSLRSSKRLKSQTLNASLTTDLSQLCLDSPNSRRPSRFKPLGEIERIQKENLQEQPIETKQIKNNSEADAIGTVDNGEDPLPHNSYNLRNRKSIIMPGKLKL